VGTSQVFHPPYQQLSVAEDIAEGHDLHDNSEELALVNLLLFSSAESVHPHKDVVRHFYAAHVAGVGVSEKDSGV
jgi:hypothetical protein